MQLASTNYISIFFINHANAFAVRSTILNYKRFQIIRDQKIPTEIFSSFFIRETVRQLRHSGCIMQAAMPFLRR